MSNTTKPPSCDDADHPAPSENEPRNVLDLLREINQKRLNPRDISSDERRACVAHFGAEGFTVPEMAGLLGCSDRTIARDRQALRELRALEHDPKLADQMAGEILYQAHQCIERIRRTTRDKEVPPATRLDGERAVFEIMDKMVHRLQTLGHLPSSAQQIEATLTHRLEDLPTLAQIHEEAKRVDCIELPKGLVRMRYSDTPGGLFADGGGLS